MKTISQVREAFWDANPQFRSEYRKTYRQNEYGATIRTAFVEFVDQLNKDGQISEKLAYRVTL